MNGEVGDLVRELKTLRKGRGILANGIGERIGAALRRVAGARADDSPIDLRDRVADTLRRLALELPGDLRIGITAAFALSDEVSMPFYQDRVAWAAAKLNRDQRTVRRRIDQGIERMAEYAIGVLREREADADHASPGWHLEQLFVAVALDLPTVEVLEYRRVVAERDDVRELELGFTLTSPRADTPPDRLAAEGLGLDVFYGGRLDGRRMETTDRVGFRLVLPRPLRRNETHEFLLRVRIPDGTPVQPHYVCVLKNPCDVFDLRVRFDPGNPPVWVSRLAGVFQRDVEDPTPIGEPVAPDASGEVVTQFHDVSVGLSYGLRWRLRTA
jgi:hypothetical protein